MDIILDKSVIGKVKSSITFTNFTLKTPSYWQPLQNKIEITYYKVSNSERQDDDDEDYYKIIDDDSDIDLSTTFHSDFTPFNYITNFYEITSSENFTDLAFKFPIFMDLHGASTLYIRLGDKTELGHVKAFGLNDKPLRVT
jgi:hypothetical protein